MFLNYFEANTIRLMTIGFTQLGVFLGFTLSVAGAALGIAGTGVSIFPTSFGKKRANMTKLLNVILCEMLAIYGLIIVFIFRNTVKQLNDIPTGHATLLSSSVGIFVAGASLGIINLFTGIGLGNLGHLSNIAENKDCRYFSTFIIPLCFISVIPIYGFVVAIMIFMPITDIVKNAALIIK